VNGVNGVNGGNGGTAERMAEWQNGRSGYIRQKWLHMYYLWYTHTDDDDNNDDDDDDDDDNNDNDDNDTLIFYSIDCRPCDDTLLNYFLQPRGITSAC
jgi:hypothetical protein